MPLNSTNAAQGYYLEKFGFGKHPHITTCFKKCNFGVGEAFQCRVTQIYDPSKFWIVVKYQELEYFQKHLFRFYYVNHPKYQVPESKIEQFMYCVVSADGGYYRAVIVGVPVGLSDEQEYMLYLFDFGMLKSVTGSDIYYLNKQYADVPQFVVRACLAEMCPKKSQQWTCDDITKFANLVTDKVLIGVVVNVAEDAQMLEVKLREKNETVPVHEKLIQEGCARYFDEKAEIEDCNASNQPGGLEPKLEYAYLFPGHEAIESGKIPTTKYDAEFQMAVSPSANILTRYYKQDEED